VVARHQRLAVDSRATRATLDLALLALARLGDVCDLEQLAARLERLAGGGAPAPRPKVAAPVRQPEASPGRPVASDRVAEQPERPRLRLQPRAKPAKPAEEQAAAAAEPEPPVASPAPPRHNAAATALSSEELARIRTNERVREVLAVFGGQIEQVRRIDDG
jgi:hypothetical protein